MPVTFRIFPDRGLVYVRYDGFVALEEVFAVVDAYFHHPERSPGQRHLIDLAHVTGFEINPLNQLKLQARKVEIFSPETAETLIVYYAPSRVARDMAELTLKSWDGIGPVVLRVQEEEADVLTLLGQPENTLTALLKTTA